LGVAYSTLKRWIRLGQVRSTQTSGGHHRIATTEIERLLASQGSVPRKVAPSAQDDPLIGLSARNRLAGFVEEVRLDGLLAQVRLRVGDQLLTAVITADAVHDMKLKRGDDALAIIKSTEVMIARRAPASGPVRANRPARKRRSTGSR
jgi:molybdopterin-binding protein